MILTAIDGVNDYSESAVSAQKKFIKDVNALIETVHNQTVANPYSEMDSDLVTLNTGEIMDPEITSCHRHVKDIGKALYEQFVHERIETYYTQIVFAYIPESPTR